MLEMRSADDVARDVRVLPPGRAGHERAPSPDPDGHPLSTGGRPFEPGERVLLFDTKGRRYLVSLEKGGEFHSHTGTVAHDAILGHEDGATARSSRGSRYIAVRPTLAEVVLKMPRGAQVIYPKDLGPILVMADIFPDARVLEAGLGSGALSMTLLVVAVLGGISMIMALAGTLYPVPAPPYSWLPYLYFVYLLITLVFFFRTRHKGKAVESALEDFS